jgi:hypothetical protein
MSKSEGSVEHLGSLKIKWDSKVTKPFLEAYFEQDMVYITNTNLSNISFTYNATLHVNV